MAELVRKNWQDGWLPSENAIGGKKTGLLRMDNLYLDDSGVVSLVPGLSRKNSAPLSGAIHTLYSQNFDNKKIRFAGLTNGSIIAAVQDFSSSAEVLTGGNSEIASFCTMYGWVFAASGKKVVRYNITTVEAVGLHKPDAPKITNNTGPSAHIVESYDSATVDTGTEVDRGNYIKITTDDNLGAVTIVPQEKNTMVLTDNGKGADTDVIQMPFVAADSSKILRVRLEFFVSDSDYYYMMWTQGEDGSPLNEGKNVISLLSATRAEFQRAGSSSNGDWTSITNVRMSVLTTEATDVQFQEIFVFGGNAGTLTGPYQYRCIFVAKAQTNGVTNYIAKSPASDPTETIYTNHNTVNVYLPQNPPKDYFVDECWIYRRSADASFDINPLTEPRRLDRWYRVKVMPGTGGGSFEDKLSDADALKDGFQLDETVISIADLDEEIIGMSGLVAGRNWYLTNSQVIPSVVESPDSYAPIQTTKLSGSNAEKNLWICKADDGSIYVGTTEDVYRITGRFLTMNDGTIDIDVRGLGLGNGFQPISRSFCTARGSIFYLSGNGWISLAGATPQLLVGDLDFLFRKRERHGFPYVNIIPNGLAIYAVCVRKNQLWCSNVMSDGTRRLFVYDFERKYWHVRNIDPIALFTEDDGTILGGFGGGSGNFVNELDTGSDLAGVNGQNFHLLTVSDDFERPNSRKDVYTIRIWAKSDKAVSIELAVDGGAFTQIGNKNFGSGSEFYIDLSKQMVPKKSYALQLKGTDATLFEFYGITFEYEPRPEQLNYLRVAPTNLGTISRKRFTSYAIVLDTLGNPVDVTPYVDNVAQPTVAFTTAEKLTVIYFFASETIGTDISAIIRSQNEQTPFEFYTPNLEETVSEKLPTPTTFLVIPATDYGNPNRKRHSSYKFQINTRGQSVTFTPKIDGVSKTPLDFSTSEKRTVIFYFTEDNIGIDVGGTLSSSGSTPFEFYGIIVPQNLEVFPPQLKEYRSPETNFGVAAKKRVRTLPFRINTNGSPVTFTPIVDNISLSSSTHSTANPATVYHYFDTDIFGTDFACEIVGTGWFEFYNLEKPEEVQVLPVGKRFDQVGPISFDRLGKLLAIRIRAVFFDTEVPVKVYVEDVAVATFTLDTISGVDKIYEFMQFPKTIAGTTMRFEIGPTVHAFHRYTVDIKANVSGLSTSGKTWMKLK